MRSDIAIEFPRRSVDALMAQMQRARRELGKSVRDSVAWAGTYVASSLAASTRIAPKLRPVIENPDKRYKTDRRRAPFGVMAPQGRGAARAMKFKPIYRTGEYGEIRFFDKKSFSWFERDRGSYHWEKLPSGPDPANPEIWAPGIMSDKRRVIGRRGLAAKSWRFMGKFAKRGGVVKVFDVQRAGEASWSGTQENPALLLRNELNYAGDAFKSGGKQAVSSALSRAADRLSHQIDQRAAKLMGAR